MKLRQVAWIFWLAGTALIGASWTGAVTHTVGWTGFGIALLGTLLSMGGGSQPSPEDPRS